MKIKGCLLISCLFLTSSIFANKAIVVKQSPASVKVFLRGAQLQYSAKVKLDKGMNDIVFTGLAANIDRNSISVSAKGEAVILSVSPGLNFLHEQVKSPQIKMLEDSLEIQNKLLSENQNESDAFKSELDLISETRKIGNEKTGTSPAELQKMGEYFRQRIPEIKSRMYEFSLAAKKIQKNIERIQNQLNELNDRMNRPASEIMITADSKTGGYLEIDLTYLIYDAGWVPSYDIRVNNISSPAAVNYKGDIWQNSGFDWNEIKIILSTRNPVVNNEKPELHPWYLDFQKNVLYKEMTLGAKRAVADAPVMLAQEAVLPKAETMADYIEAVATQLSVEFTPSINYSIPSDNKPHSVALSEFTLPAGFEYYAAPKLDNNAFLVAKLTNWNNLNLISGTANIYFENSYVGQTRIDPESAKDTLAISLGRDQNISVEREMLKDFSENKFLSSNQERIFGYNINIKNNKNSAVKILIEDQIPISKNEEIEVKLTESSGASYNPESGKLKWNVELNGGKSAAKKLIFSVKYPKEKKIQGL